MHHFKNIASSTAILLLVLGVIAAPEALATEPSPDPGDESSTIDEIRFHESMELVRGRSSLDVKIWRGPDEARRIWHVQVAPQDRPDSALCRTTLPLEAGQNFYDLTLQHHSTGQNRHLVLLEIRPDRSQAPMDSPVYQLAFQIEEHAGAAQWRCNMVARGEFSRLDGGAVLSVEGSRDARQLIRRGAADDMRFCGLRSDEDPAYERFDPETGRFMQGAVVDIIMEDAGELDAQLPPAPLTPPLTENFYSWISATGDIRGAPAGASVPRPLTLGDLDLTTAWVVGEGGEGEFVTASVSSAAKLRGLRIFPGHGRSEAHYENYGRPQQVLIGFSDGFRYVVDLPEHSFDEVNEVGGLYIELPEPIITRCVSVMILESAAGELATSSNADERRLGQASAIAEITPYSTLDADSEAETARRIIDELAREPSPRRRDRIAEFGTLIPDAMAQTVSETLAEDDEIRRQRAMPILGRLPPDVALPVLATHFHRVAVDSADYRITKRTIASHGSLAAPTLLEILERLDQEEDSRKYIDTVRLIGRVGTEDHLLSLIDELGQGGEMLRNERIRAIAAGGVDVVPRLIAEARAQGDNEAGLDALTTIVFVGQRHFSDAPGEVDEVDLLREVYAESNRRPHRIRAIESLGYFVHPDGVAILGQEILAQDPDPLLRRFAAGALRLYAGDEARQWLETALQDSSPDVRIAAIQALGRRPDASLSTEAVIAYAFDEQWPRGLHHAMHLLAHSPDAAALAALAAVIAADITSTSAATALRALRRADRPLPISDIVDHLGEERTPIAMMRQLVNMLAISDASQAEEILLAISDGDYEGIEDRSVQEIDELTRQALMALGKRGGEEAMAYLLATVADEGRTIEDRTFALRGLAFFVEPVLVDELRDLTTVVPRELVGALRETLRLVRNRLAIDDAHRDVEQILETLENNDDEADEFDEP